MSNILKNLDPSLVRFKQSLHAGGMPAVPHMQPLVVMTQPQPKVEGMFPLHSHILQRQWLHAEGALARDKPKWSWLNGITVKCLFRRCLALWMRREVQYDLQVNAHSS